MRSITWPVHRGSPKTTRNNFLTPNCLFTIQLLWSYDDDSGYFILEHPHVKAVFGRKKSGQNRSPKWRFFKFYRLNRKYSHRDPPKALTRNNVIWRILRKYPFRGVGCSLIKKPKKTNKKLVTPEARQNRVFGEQKPLNRSLQNFAPRVPSRT